MKGLQDANCFLPGPLRGTKNNVKTTFFYLRHQAQKSSPRTGKHHGSRGRNSCGLKTFNAPSEIQENATKDEQHQKCTGKGPNVAAEILQSKDKAPAATSRQQNTKTRKDERHQKCTGKGLDVASEILFAAAAAAAAAAAGVRMYTRNKNRMYTRTT